MNTSYLRLSGPDAIASLAISNELALRREAEDWDDAMEELSLKLESLLAGAAVGRQFPPVVLGSGAEGLTHKLRSVCPAPICEQLVSRRAGARLSRFVKGCPLSRWQFPCLLTAEVGSCSWI